MHYIVMILFSPIQNELLRDCSRTGGGGDGGF